MSLASLHGSIIVSVGMENDNPSAGQQHSGRGGVDDEAPTAVVTSEGGYYQQQAFHNNAQTLTDHNGPSNASNSMDMSNLAGALPDYMYRQVPQQMYGHHYPQQMLNTAVYPQYQGAQYPAGMQGSYPLPYSTQMHPQAFSGQRPFVPYPINANVGGGHPVYTGQTFFPQQQSMSPIYQGQYRQSPQAQVFGQAQASVYGGRGSGQYHGAQIRIDNYGNTVPSTQIRSQTDTIGIRRTSSNSSLKVLSALRGPPRKPRQSGHALWVGNLPPGTNILDLKDHFSREATDDIESVFLISKSNCAFVNYKNEQSCAAAMGRFHDSRFNGVRLVCRLRRGSSPTTATIPASILPNTPPEMQQSSTTRSGQDTEEEVDKQESSDLGKQTAKVKERYFIIKSLTIEDLERSVHSGIWATQSHNEEILNKAYQTAESVYLIFSANKSGEYFGYARMETSITGDAAAALEVSSPEGQTPHQTPIVPSPAELPLTIPTPATATAPKGYVIDDSARGTIFWEAESVSLQMEPGIPGLSPGNTDSGEASGEETTEGDPKSPSSGNVLSSTTTFGKPFKITWVSTERLPFYRTRGLRNPWNTNREVKIARDGTELEPGVGRKLIGMFNPNSIAGRSQSQGMYANMAQAIPGQGPAYRPY